jgi:hypothetical protein
LKRFEHHAVDLAASWSRDANAHLRICSEIDANTARVVIAALPATAVRRLCVEVVVAASH